MVLLVSHTVRILFFSKSDKRKSYFLFYICNALILLSPPSWEPVASPDFVDCKVELDVMGKEEAIVSLDPLIQLYCKK